MLRDYATAERFGEHRTAVRGVSGVHRSRRGGRTHSIPRTVGVRPNTRPGLSVPRQSPVSRAPVRPRRASPIRPARTPYGYYYATGPNYWAMATASASSVTAWASVTTLPTIKPATGYFIKARITNTSGVALDFVLAQATGGAGTAAEDPGTWTDALGNYTIGPVPAGI